MGAMLSPVKPIAPMGRSYGQRLGKYRNGSTGLPL